MKKYISTLTIALAIICIGFAATKSYGIENSRPEKQTRQKFRSEAPKFSVEKMLNKIEEKDPDKAQELRELREKDPNSFRTEFRKYMKENKEMFRMHHDKHMLMERRGKERMHELDGGKYRKDARGHRPSHRSFREQREEEFRGWLDANYPEVIQKMSTLEANPEKFEDALMKIKRKYYPIFMAEKRSPEFADLMKRDLELQSERDRILSQYKTAKNDKNKKKAKSRLAEILSERFDILISKKEMKYKNLQEKLEQLERELKEQSESLVNLKNQKEEILDERLNELLNKEEKEFDWEE